MSTRQRLLAGLAALLLVALAIWVFPRLFEQVSTEVPQPATGEAAYNPLYALKLAVRERGLPVSAWPNLSAAEHALGPRDSLLLYDRPEAISAAQAQRLLDWVRAGGHLLMPGPAPGSTPGPLAESLGLRAQALAVDDDDEEEQDCEQLLLEGESAAKGKETWLCDPRFVSSVPGFVFGGGDDKRGYRFARRPLGSGLVTIAEMDNLNNEALRAPAARVLAYQLLAPGLFAGRVHLVYSADVPSLWRLLLVNGWMVLLPLLLALAAWLIWRGQRFGPLLPAPEPRRRALFEHVQAAGEFAFRRNRGAALHASVLRLFRQRLQRREPALAALDGEAQVLALADATALPASRVRQALLPHGLHHPATFTQSIATLLQMRSRL